MRGFAGGRTAGGSGGTRGGGLKEAGEFFFGHVDVAQDAVKQAGAEGVFAVDGDGGGAPVGVA